MACTEPNSPASNLLAMFPKFFWILALLSVPAVAGEFAVLTTGFRVHADRHEVVGDRVRLYSKDSVTEFPAGMIASFEEEEYVVPPAVDAALPEAARVVKDPKILVHEAAIHTGLPPAFVESVAQVESHLRTDAVSPKGARGVMQLMPATAKELAADPNDPQQNIEAGARLLRDLLLKFDGDVVKALAAYNAGSGAVQKYGGMPPYPETQNYVDKVIRSYLSTGAK